MTRVVVDASVAFKWYVREPQTPQARRLLSPSYEMIVPDLIWPELASALWKRVQRQQMTHDEAHRALLDLRRVPIETHAMERLAPRALDLAVGMSRSVYDCLYLALAEREMCQMVTADQRFYQAIAATPLKPRVLWIENL